MGTTFNSSKVLSSSLAIAPGILSGVNPHVPEEESGRIYKQ